MQAEAIITFLTTSAGGRRAPVKSGYRPKFWYLGLESDPEHSYLDASVVRPGDTVKTKLHFFRPYRLHVGMPFQVREDKKVIGEGVVTKI